MATALARLLTSLPLTPLNNPKLQLSSSFLSFGLDLLLPICLLALVSSLTSPGFIILIYCRCINYFISGLLIIILFICKKLSFLNSPAFINGKSFILYLFGASLKKRHAFKMIRHLAFYDLLSSRISNTYNPPFIVKVGHTKWYMYIDIDKMTWKWT